MSWSVGLGLQGDASQPSLLEWCCGVCGHMCVRAHAVSSGLVLGGAHMCACAHAGSSGVLLGSAHVCTCTCQLFWSGTRGYARVHMLSLLECRWGLCTCTCVCAAGGVIF